ncbi:elongation factor P [Candidatus Peregrinibacteria bacterium]|nr:MAG: elongation factor P [Candidatus Peregrinibacteria bacterium]
MDTNKLRTGHKIMYDKAPYVVVQYTLRPQSRGSAKMITKLKNLLTGAVIEKTFQSGENLEEADITNARAQFLYADGDEYIFMDNDTYDQFTFSKDKLGDTILFLKDNIDVDIMKFNGNPINIQLPPTLTYKVTHTEPGVRGDTVSGGSKPATIESGAVVQVPFFINIDDDIVVNTISGDYKERAKS